MAPLSNQPLLLPVIHLSPTSSATSANTPRSSLALALILGGRLSPGWPTSLLTLPFPLVSPASSFQRPRRTPPATDT